MKMTTIQVETSVLKGLQSIKNYPRQTYNELLKELITTVKNSKKETSYDKFLYEIQKTKMQELWDNKEDEIWDKL